MLRVTKNLKLTRTLEKESGRHQRMHRTTLSAVGGLQLLQGVRGE